MNVPCELIDCESSSPLRQQGPRAGHSSHGQEDCQLSMIVFRSSNGRPFSEKKATLIGLRLFVLSQVSGARPLLA